MDGHNQTNIPMLFTFLKESKLSNQKMPPNAMCLTITSLAKTFLVRPKMREQQYMQNIGHI